MSDANVEKVILGLPPEQQALAREAMALAKAVAARPPAAAPKPAPKPVAPKASVGGWVALVFLVLFAIASGNWILQGCHNTLTDCKQAHTCGTP